MDTSKLEDIIIELVKNSDRNTIINLISLMQEVLELNGKRGKPKEESKSNRASNILEGSNRNYTPKQSRNQDVESFFDAVYQQPRNPTPQIDPENLPGYVPGPAITNNDSKMQNYAAGLL